MYQEEAETIILYSCVVRHFVGFYHYVSGWSDCKEKGVDEQENGGHFPIHFRRILPK